VPGITRDEFEYPIPIEDADASLRDIETCLRVMQSKLYHMGIRGRVARSTLADANVSQLELSDL